ncbi:FAD/NAD(P)-binding protein [Bradyrhizobium sp. CCBAU 51765]|uniref:NAD(P)-binding protein n=1 Tax=Bradyrhizobium sp. CCBAU 51765 TaxID=1325102 RepID=UPI001886F96F|nr:FAD/NAD(P)-binding protein [Bradyrhizobium sp. CCBAU 51765]QOZ06642.1 hypothetical protein XH96_03250 [Bradyrhizobium sp. CCBAU 51765]
MIECGLVLCALPGKEPPKKRKLAIVGGGFAGLTFAAGLIAKRANVDITIFEQRDVLLPLQHGSDTRWLHPQIYNWPGPGSEVTAAMLPIMNWTAARASDVAAQLLSEWKNFASRQSERTRLFCNTRHLQIRDAGSTLQIEWIGERRDPRDGGILNDAQKSALGASETFDCIVLAVGFGIERDDATSYWRNEEFGQPSLNQPRKTYLISGQGDGALIDLLRLRVSYFRQDRILDQLFSRKQILMNVIEKLYSRQRAKRPPSLFNELEKLYHATDPSGTELNEACNDLRLRLRRDTEVVLHMRQRSFAAIFGPGTSFQNRLLVYLLFKCGGFFPTDVAIPQIVAQHSIPDDCIVIRHGTYREEQFQKILSGKLVQEFNRRTASGRTLSLTDTAKWSGGYFGFPGSSKQARRLPDVQRKTWRKEYLPSPTNLVVSALCSGIAGLLVESHPKNHRLRVTVHRAIVIHGQELLQQACEYQGLLLEGERAAGRTFPADNATIGVAYKCRQIVRSRKRVKNLSLRQTMQKLRLNDASSEMRRDVGFVLAIPMIESGQVYTAPSPVVGVIYVDSNAPGYYIDDTKLAAVVSIAQRFLESLAAPRVEQLGHVRNFPLSELTRRNKSAPKLPTAARITLELAPLLPPSTNVPFQLNYDVSEFVPTRGTPEVM